MPYADPAFFSTFHRGQLSEGGRGDAVIEVKHLKGKSGGSPQGAALQCFTAARSCGLEGQLTPSHKELARQSLAECFKARL